MLTQAVLSTILYLPRPRELALESDVRSPIQLAESVLEILGHLSFVISKFGGITASDSAEGGGFKELQRAFYTAVDILSSDPKASERLVEARLLQHQP